MFLSRRMAAVVTLSPAKLIWPLATRLGMSVPLTIHLTVTSSPSSL